MPSAENVASALLGQAAPLFGLPAPGRAHFVPMTEDPGADGIEDAEDGEDADDS